VLSVRVLVILPTYNEAPNIAEVIQRLHQACSDAGVLVVDDASPDGTAQVVEALASEFVGVELLRRTHKLGFGSACLDGFRRGLEQGFDALVAMDSDLSHDPNVLPQLLEHLESAEQHYGLVIGSRYVPGGSIPQWSWYRLLLSRWGNQWARLMLGLPVLDATSGYRVYRAATLEKIDLDEVRSEGYGFQIEMVRRIVALGGSVAEVPIAFVDRVAGESKMSTRIIVEALWLVTWWSVQDRVWGVRNRVRKLRKFSESGR